MQNYFGLRTDATGSKQVAGLVQWRRAHYALTSPGLDTLAACG